MVDMRSGRATQYAQSSIWSPIGDFLEYLDLTHESSFKFKNNTFYTGLCSPWLL